MGVLRLVCPMLILIAALAAMPTGPLHGMPFVPQDDATVLERLRQPNDPVIKELKTLAAAVRQQPEDLQAAVHLAQRYIEVARTRGDPRYAGYAEAVIAPWLRQEPPPPPILLLRATLRQNRHDFEGALADLDQVLAQRPGDPQALLVRATVHQVRADYPAATRDCAALDDRVLPLIRTVCAASVMALTGQAKAAFDQLSAALAAAAETAPDGIRAWALTTLGEIAAQRGSLPEAEALFGQAASLNGSDIYLTSARADLLLDQARASEVRDLLGDDLRPDALLLRHALAAKALDDDDLGQLQSDLAARFAASARRQDQRHLREEARFRLHLTGDAETALALAARNWQTQREPADARILLEAVLATGRLEAAGPVLAWLTQNSVEDVMLKGLADRIEGQAP